MVPAPAAQDDAMLSTLVKGENAVQACLKQFPIFHSLLNISSFVWR